MSDLFTIEPVNWSAWVEPVDFDQLSTEQAALVQSVTQQGVVAVYNAVMLHDPQIFPIRSALLRSIMYAPSGLSRAERELASVAVSYLNGCGFCASTHARLLVQASKGADTEIVRHLFEHGTWPQLSPRQQAIVDFAEQLAVQPDQITTEQITNLQNTGLQKSDIVDLIHVVALFSWYNRLFGTLGNARLS